MIKLLIVCPYPPAKAPSQRFRFEQYIEALQKSEVAIRVSGFWSDAQWPAIYKSRRVVYKIYSTFLGFIRRFFLLFSLLRYDLVLIHREATPIGPPWWEWAAANVFRKKIIYDFDDAVWLPNVSAANEKLVGKWKNHTKTKKIISWSKMVFAGNDFLAAYAGKFCDNVVVIPTTIDFKLHDVRKKNAKDSKPHRVILGWTGTHSTIKQLTPLFKTLEEIHLESAFDFILIADVAPFEMPHFIQFIPWNKKTEIEDLAKIDIGIMPLYNTEWEKGKCGFKALQYMALETVAVVSDVGVNPEIVSHGVNGYVAEPMNGDEQVYPLWKKYLLNLIQDKELRTKIGVEGRKTIEARYSVNAFEARYVKYIKQLANR